MVDKEEGKLNVGDPTWHADKVVITAQQDGWYALPDGMHKYLKKGEQISRPLPIFDHRTEKDKRIDALEEVLKELSEGGSTTVDRSSDVDGMYCLFCAEWWDVFEKEMHDEDCPILRARQLLSKKEEEA